MAEDVTTVIYQLTASVYRLKEEGMEPTRIDIQKRFAVRLREEYGQPPDPEWDPKPLEKAGEFMGIPVYVMPDAEVVAMVTGKAEAFVVTGARKHG